MAGASNVDPEGGLRVGYILKMFPRLSETFILNEILELERQDVTVDVFSLMTPGDGRFHGRLSELKLTAQNLVREKAESVWEKVQQLPPELVPPMEKWQEAVTFLRHHRIPKDLDMLLRALLITAEARRRGIQHFHAHFATIATRFAAVVNILSGIPFSFTCHAKDIFRQTVDRALFSDLVERSAFAITVSDFNRNWIIDRTPDLSSDRLIRLYNGIDTSFFTPPERTSLPEVPHIVSVGRLVPKKGFDHLLNAFAQARSAGMEFTATIIGDGDEEENLQSQCSQLGLDDVVDLAGGLAQEKVRQICSDSTIMALGCVPDSDGNMDALPTVLLEALALDLPIVTTTLTGNPEIVGDEAGILVPPADPTALARGLQELWERMKQGKQTPGTARKRAERLFHLPTNVGTLRGHFQQSARGA